MLPKKLRTIRRIYAVFFLALFLFFLWVTDYGRMKGYETSLFLELDPLVAIAGFFSSGTVYKGLLWSLAIIIPTLFLGRFFCSWICPLGILNQFLGYFFNHKRPVEEYRLNRYRPMYRIKYYILMVLLVLALFGSLQIGLFDPIALLVRSFTVSVFPAANQMVDGVYLSQPVFHGGVVIALILLVILLANRFMNRFWCRVLCPLGAILGILSRRAVFRIQRDVDRCTDCDKCLQFCQGGCDPDRELRVSECHVCMNCVEQCPTQALHYGLPRASSSVHQPLDLNRRRLVEIGVAAAVLFPMLRSSVSAGSTPSPGAIRPPGSLDEEEFLARCIKCAACMRVCPTNVLQPALLEAGFEGIWSPILLNRIGYCEHHCVLCGQVCPTGAITSISVAEKVGGATSGGPIKIGTAFYDRGRCLPWAMHIPCIVCEEMCPTSPKAIWFKTEEVKDRDGGWIALQQPYLEPSLCIGCGICENKCPVEDKAAIRVTSVGETRSQVNRMLLEKQ
ncbi:MAG: 4Fe-4S binding protein [Gammaproteobacteria bacterium]|nr:4Fe-4S binding protein [Gammaproteobacteria bacterium]